MHLYFRLIVLIGLIVTINSCGRKAIEEDKHPDLPYFPETTATKIKFETINFNPHGFYKIDDAFFRITEVSDIHYLQKFSVFYYKDDLTTQIGTMPLVDDYRFIDENGFSYCYHFETDISKYDVSPAVTKTHVITGEKKNIDYVKADYGSAYENIFKANEDYEKQLTHLADSVIREIRFKRIDSVKKEINTKFTHSVLKGLQKVRKINLNSRDNSFLLQYKNKEVVLKNAPFWHSDDAASKCPLDLLETYAKYNDLEPIVVERIAGLNVFDHAVRGNHLGPGKINFFLQQSGIQYYELNYKNEKTFFKLNSKSLYNHNLIQLLLMPDNKTMLLYSDDRQFKLAL